jgi:hypothetical protein
MPVADHSRRVTAAARQRQTTYELERHPFEANTLTQLFLILSKHKASWWREQNDESSGGPPKRNEGGVTTQHDQSGVGLEASMTAASSAVGTPMKQRHRAQSVVSPSSAHEASINTLRNDEATPISHDPKELLKRRKAFAARQRRSRDNTTQPSPTLQIPDTVVWENNIPKGWFYFDSKELHVARRKVETKQIQEAFLKDALFENDIVAVVYSVTHNHHPLQGSSSPSHGGAGGRGTFGASSPDDGTEALQYRYLTAAELPIFLFENRRGKGTSVLQKFVYPLNIQHNDCIQVVWSPSVTQVNRRQNIHDIFDERIDPNERCGTFECRTHLSRNVQCTPRLEQLITQMCLELVKHFQETDSKFVVSRLVLHTKITDSHDLVLLYCSSARVLPAAAAMPLPLPSGISLQVFPDPSTSGSSGVSQLQKKFRVSLEIATQYSVKPVEDQRHNAAGNQASKRRGTYMKGPSDDELGAALAEGRRSFSRPGSSVGGANGAGDAGRSSPVASPQRGSHSDTTMNVTVGGRSAAHHGFLIRSNAPSSPQRSGSVSSPSAGKTLGGERGRMMSFRASSSAERLSLIGIVQDVLRAEERKEGVSDQHRTKAKHLLQAALKKVGATSMRTALLQTRPNEELTEFEKMELLFLKMQELERRRMRRGSSSNLLESSPPPTFHHRGGGGQHTSFEDDSSSIRPHTMSGSLALANASLQRNVVMDGVLARDIDASVEDRWMEIAYAAQTHFDTLALGGKDVPYLVALDGREGGADAAILRWLQARKTITESVGEIRRGVAQLEGATFRFDLGFDGSSPSPSLWTQLVTFTVPQQVRAAQKLFHEAHEAMSSKRFVQFVRDAMKYRDDIQRADLTRPDLTESKVPDHNGADNASSLSSEQPLGQGGLHDGGLHDDCDDSTPPLSSNRDGQVQVEAHQPLGASAQYSDEFDES